MIAPFIVPGLPRNRNRGGRFSRYVLYLVVERKVNALVSQLDLGRTSTCRVRVSAYCGSISVRITANANTATAKANATTRTLRCSNFPDALAKKSTVANKTVLARYCPETLPALRAFCRLLAALALASAASRVPRTSYSFGTNGWGSAFGFSKGLSASHAS